MLSYLPRTTSRSKSSIACSNMLLAAHNNNGSLLNASSSHSTVSASSALLGWVPQPNQRGTMDIIWSCVSTLFICVWAILHLNVPAAQDNEVRIFFRRFRWMLLMIFAPELVMLYAAGQWTSARRSITDMASLGYRGWTLTHGFYADSGGFLLYSDDCVAFPVTAKQLHYLVQHEHVPMPTLSRREIWDKSKADLVAKTIATFQAGWLVTQCIARGIQHLPITILELSTLAMISCTACTAFFWMQKPLGVETPTSIFSKSTITQILLSAGEAAKDSFKDTPLDFIESQTYTSGQLPLHQWWGVQERPLTRIPNDRDPRLHNLSMVLTISLPVAAFPLLHFIGWSFDFPTKLELLMWRWTSVAMTLILGIYSAIETVGIIKDGYTTSSLTNLGSYKLRWPRNILFFAPATLYTLTRAIVIVETVISLRLLPPGCFDVVQWSELFPHL